jgi:hypothetical protein
MSISDPARRSDQLTALGGAWLNYDPPTAKDWINTNMPAEIKSQLLSPGGDGTTANAAAEDAAPEAAPQTGPYIVTAPEPDEPANTSLPTPPESTPESTAPSTDTPDNSAPAGTPAPDAGVIN